MKKFIVSASLALVAATAPLAGAQQTSGGAEPGSAVTAGHGSFYVGPYAGYMVFGKFGEGTGVDQDVSFDSAPFYGAQIGYSFSPNFSIVGNAAYSKTPFTIKYNDGQERNFGEDVNLYFYDANLQFRLPFVANRVGSTIAPFAQLGVGAFKRSTTDLRDATDNLEVKGETNVAFNGGVGVDFQIRKQIGLRLMAKDYVTSFGFKDAGDISSDDQIANNFAFTAGLNFGF